MINFSIDWLQTLSMLGRVALAAVLAGFIGFEREYVQRNAGMRTHILVAIGAALVMCSGEFLKAQYPNSNIDPARIGAQVVSGIGFLCAGTIIKEGISVRGLTTASSLWCVSCVGLAAGCGNGVLAIATTGLILIVLRVLRNMAHNRRKKGNRLVLQVVLSMEGQSIVQLQEDLERMGCLIDEFSFAIDTKNLKRHVYAHLTLPDRDNLAPLMEGLSRIEGLESVESVYE
ncbi:MAG TPA: methyltransferase [Clostridiales bacterium]|jgi:putative Mg2+ transporter-C (MgtC) family protein|nr:methyltransferase [Clostridiales bacterium]